MKQNNEYGKKSKKPKDNGKTHPLHQIHKQHRNIQNEQANTALSKACNSSITKTKDSKLSKKLNK